MLERLAALADGSDASSLGESYWAVRRLLETLAARTPVLLVLDDVHWAEPALLDLVDYLAERVAAPLLVLCLARPELERPLGETLALGPLDAAEARAVSEQIAELDARDTRPDRRARRRERALRRAARRLRGRGRRGAPAHARGSALRPARAAAGC